MATVVGVRSINFTGKEGNPVTGKNIYFTEPLKDGEGVSAERVFLSMDKLLACQYDPKVGDEVHIEYNRYGRCSGVYPED